MKRVAPAFLVLALLLIAGLGVVFFSGQGDAERTKSTITSNIAISNVTKIVDCRNYWREPDNSNITKIRATESSIEIYSDQNTEKVELIHVLGLELRPGSIEFELYRHNDDNYSTAWNGYITIGAIQGAGKPFFQLTTYYGEGKWAIINSSGQACWTGILNKNDTWRIKLEIYENGTYNVYINDTLILQYHTSAPSTTLLPTGQEFIIRFPSGANSTNVFHYTVRNIIQTYKRNLITSIMIDKYIAYIMDDATTTEYNFSQVLHENGYTATIAVITSKVNTTNHMTLSDLKNVTAWGFEIADHTVHHYDLTSVNWSTVQTEISDAKTWIEQNLNVEVKTFVPPGGKTNITIDEYAWEHGMYDPYFSYRRPLADNTSDTYDSTFFRILSFIENGNGVLVLYNHGDVDLTTEHLENFISTAKENKWTIGTYENFRAAAWGLWKFHALNVSFTETEYTFKANCDAFVEVNDYYDMLDRYGIVRVLENGTEKARFLYGDTIKFWVEAGKVYTIEKADVIKASEVHTLRSRGYKSTVKAAQLVVDKSNVVIKDVIIEPAATKGISLFANETEPLIDITERSNVVLQNVTIYCTTPILYAIKVEYSDNVVLDSCNVYGQVAYAVSLSSSKNVTIYDCTIALSGNEVNISGNTVNTCGIALVYSHNVDIQATITKCRYGILFVIYTASNVTTTVISNIRIHDSKLYNNGDAIRFNDYSETFYNQTFIAKISNIEITRNNIFSNSYGIRYYRVNNLMMEAEDVYIYFNNFYDNAKHVYFLNISGVQFYHLLNDTNSTLNGKVVGNYYDDYSGVDRDGDGIGDDPYIIDGGAIDKYPLTHKFEYYLISGGSGGSWWSEEYYSVPLWMWIVIALLIVLLIVLILKGRKRRWRR